MRKKISSIICVILALAFVLSGCGGNISVPTQANSAVDVVIIGGCRANQPNPAYGSDTILDSLNSVNWNTGTATLIVNDGAPFAADVISISAMKSGVSDAKREAIVHSKTNAILCELQNTRAVTDEVDTLTSFALASRSFTAAHDRIIVILDNGLSTSGYVNFQNNLLRVGDPQTIVDYLKNKNALPDLTGVQIYWIGLGDVAGSQEQLTPSNRITLQAIWSSILTECGATVSFDSSLPSSTYDTTLPYVTPIEVYQDDPLVVQNLSVEPQGPEPLPISILDETRLAFISDSTEFVDPQAAIYALDPIIEVMKNDPTKKILLCGTTATVGSNESCCAFSERRAEGVKAIMAAAGISEDRITCIGLGYDNQFHIPDLNANGSLNNNAPKNRSVVILDLLSEDAKRIKDNEC